MQPKDGASSYRWHDRDGPNRYRHDRPKDQLRVVALKLQRHCTGRSRKLKLYDFTSHFPIPEPAHPRLSLAADVDWFHRHWTGERTARDEHAIASPVPRRPFRHGVPAASVAATRRGCTAPSALDMPENRPPASDRAGRPDPVGLPGPCLVRLG